MINNINEKKQPIAIDLRAIPDNPTPVPFSFIVKEGIKPEKFSHSDEDIPTFCLPYGVPLLSDKFLIDNMKKCKEKFSEIRDKYYVPPKLLRELLLYCSAVSSENTRRTVIKGMSEFLNIDLAITPVPTIILSGNTERSRYDKEKINAYINAAVNIKGIPTQQEIAKYAEITQQAVSKKLNDIVFLTILKKYLEGKIEKEKQEAILEILIENKNYIDNRIKIVQEEEKKKTGVTHKNKPDYDENTNSEE